MKKLIARRISKILYACAMFFAATMKPALFSPKAPKELMDKNKGQFGVGFTMRVLREDGSGYELDDDEIIFFTTHNNVISVHTRTERYIVPTTLDQLSKAYQDLSFDKVDRSYSVRMDRIEGYHAVRKAVFFEEETTENTKFAPVSEPNMKKVLKHLNKKKDQP